MIYVVYNAFNRDFVNCFYIETKEKAKALATDLGIGWFWMEKELEVGK